MAAQGNKKMGLAAAISLVVGNMIGSGIFLLPSSLATFGGISLLGWGLSALGGMVIAKVFAELARQYPKTGGLYVFAKEGFGDFVGFLVAWGYWLSICATNAAITVTMLSYLSVFIPALEQSAFLAIGIGLATIWILTFINSLGVREASWIQIVTTVLKLVPLIMIAIVGLFYVNVDYFTPFNLSGTSDIKAIAACTTLTLFAFLGIEAATFPAESIENPEMNVPKATVWGTYITMFVYILGSFSVMGIVPPETLSESVAPFADAAVVIWGESARNWVAIGIVVSTFGALNGWIMMQGQIPMAAAQDQLFPSAFGKLNNNGMPIGSLVISSLIISVLLLMNYNASLIKVFEFSILLATLCCLISYLFSSGTYILNAFKASSKLKVFIGFMAFLFSMWAVVGSGAEIVFWGFLALMAGIPLFIRLKI